MLVVPSEMIQIRALMRSCWYGDRLSMHRVVITTVFKFIPYTAANLKMVRWRYGYVTPIKQRVNVTAEKKSVRGFVFAMFGIGSDMRSVERRKGSLPRDGTASVVIVSDQYPECTLS